MIERQMYGRAKLDLLRKRIPRSPRDEQDQLDHGTWARSQISLTKPVQ
jgi:hypothetical protein